ncbi:hypothetical protein KAT92_06650 [Candidatus Babeliales bacterium]|nr:hypothetical protein [Candidatus Babeliales bacterium]
MKRLWKFYQVSEDAGLNSGRVGMAVLVFFATVDKEPGRYKPFDKDHETALVDQDGLFTTLNQRLTPLDAAPPYAFFLRTHMGSSWYCPGVSTVTPPPPDYWTADHAMAAYGFLLPLNVMVTPAGFAAIIAGRYSLDNDQNRAVVDCLNRI